MTAARIFTILLSIGFIVAVCLTAVYYLGELQASWRRVRAEMRWQAWKRNHLVTIQTKPWWRF